MFGNVERVALPITKSVDDRSRDATLFFDLLFKRFCLAPVLTDKSLFHDEKRPLARGDQPSPLAVTGEAVG